jgi:hypothetical protein
MPEPALCVYTVSFAHAGHCLPVIRDLRRQTIASQIELIVVAETDDGIGEADLSAFHSFRFVLLPGLRTVGVAMASAVRAARAPFVVYAEEHATFEPDWAAQLVAAHQRGYPAVGFTMRNANPETLTSWAHLYGQFGPSVDPVETSEVRLLTGHHASYRRDVLLAYGPMLDAMLEDESALFLDLHQRGERLLMCGEAISYHINLSRLGAYIALDFNGQRSFADGRAKVGAWPLGKRILWACACPLVPLVRLRRIFFHLRRTRRFGKLMPQILLPIVPALAAGALGEALGYLLGPGAAAERKLGPELRRRHFLARNDPSRATGAEEPQAL